MKKAIGAGIIGCGDISNLFLSNCINVFKDVEIIAVCDLDISRAKAAAEKYHVKYTESYQEMLKMDEIQIIINLTVPSAHYEVIKEALLAGKHVYTEKPMATSFKDALELVEIAKRENLFLCGAPDTFLGAGIQTARSYLDSGIVGVPNSVTAFFAYHGCETWHPNPKTSYSAQVGPLWDMGPYYLTALVFLLGPIVAVSAMCNTAFKTRKISSEPMCGEIIQVETPTHISLNLKFASGVVGTMIVSYDVWSHNLPQIEIYCANGSISVPDPNLFGGQVRICTAKKSTRDADGPDFFKEMPPTHIEYSENEHFLGFRGIGVADLACCIRDGGTPHTICDLPLHVVEVMEGAFTSMKTAAEYKMTTTVKQPEAMARDLVLGYVR